MSGSINVATLRTTLQADTAQFTSSMTKAETSAKRLTGAMGGMASASRAMSSATRAQAQSLDQLASAARRSAVALGALAAVGTYKAVKAGVAFNAQMESNQIALEQLTGSANKARVLLGDLFEIAKKTPFEFADVTDAARKFLAFGFSVDQTKVALKGVGDAVAALGGGKEKIDRITIAFGQLQAKGRVQGDELLQLAEAGIPAYQILAEKLKLTADQVKNIGKLGIPANMAIGALLQGMQDRFRGATERQSKSWEGMWSTLKDNTRQALGAITTGLFIESKRWIAAANSATTQIAAVWKRKDLTPDQKFQQSFDAIKRDFGPLVSELGRKLKDARLGEKLSGAFESAAPRVAEAMGRLALRAIEAFGKAWWAAGLWGKLFLTSLVFKKLGVFSAAGSLAGDLMGAAFKRVFVKQAAATGVAGGVAAAGSGGLANAAVFNRMRDISMRWGKVMGRGLVVGLALAIPLYFTDIDKPLKDLDDKLFGWAKNLGGRLAKTLGVGASAPGGSVGGAVGKMLGGGGGKSKLSGGSLSHKQLMQLWVQAGGDPKVADIAAAIAQAESGGRPGAVNRSLGGPNKGPTGLWQIYGNPFNGNALDPMTNAKMAVAKWRSAGGFTPWTTFTGADTGPGGTRGPQTYRQYLTGSSTSGATPSIADVFGGGSFAAPAVNKRTREINPFTGKIETHTAKEWKDIRLRYQVRQKQRSAAERRFQKPFEGFDASFSMIGSEIAKAETTAGTADDVKAITRQRDLLSKRIKALQAQAKGKLSSKHAKQVADSLTELFRERTDAVASLADIAAQQFSLTMSKLELAVAKAEATPGTGDDIKALTDKRKEISRQISRITKMLKGKLSPARRTDLQEQLAGLFRDRKSIQDVLKDMAAGTAGEAMSLTQSIQQSLDRPAAALAAAQALTPKDFADDFKALNETLSIATNTFNNIRTGNDFDAIQMVAGVITQTQEAINGLNDAMKQAAFDKLFQPLDAALALAALTPEVADDIKAWTDLVNFWSDQLRKAQDANDFAGISNAATNLKSAQDSLKALTDPNGGAASDAARYTSGATAYGMGGTSVSIVVNGALDPDAAGRQIQGILLGLQRRSGPLGFN